MRAGLYKFIVLLLMLGFSSSLAMATTSDYRQIFVPGFTMGTRTGMMPRAGFDLSIMKSPTAGDGVRGYGVITGISGIKPFEYYVGAAAGFAYYIGAWGEVTLNFVGQDFTGVRALAAGGFIVMPYIAMGYDKRAEHGVYIETGLTFKLPLR